MKKKKNKFFNLVSFVKENRTVIFLVTNAMVFFCLKGKIWLKHMA